MKMEDCSSSGAKGIASFEQNLDFGYLPDESSIEHEGIFYDYYFRTPQTDKHFDVSFNFGITPDPLSQTPEYYLGLGIGSRLDGAGLYKYGGRPNLNLVICLDISGSMSSSFTYEEAESKLSVAKSSLLVLLSKLRPDDSFGLVVFDTEAEAIHPLQAWKNTNVKELKEKILKIETRGGTDLSVGLNTSASLFQNNINSKNSNRIVFMTDMLVNSGTADGEGLYNLTKEFVQKKIFMTFIGVGADFNTELVSKLTLLRGTNYLSVNNTKEFKKHMEDEFDYLVTPSVYDVEISFTSNAWSVDRVYGSPGFEYPAQGKLVQIDSTFPSPEDKEHPGMTKGGIVIVKLHKLAETSDPVIFTLTYEDNMGEKHKQVYSIVLPKWSGEQFEDTSLQKGVLLVRYVNFMKHYLRNAVKVPNISTSTGITIPPLLQKENRHKSLTKVANLTEEWRLLFNKMIEHFAAQTEVIQDKTLEKELKRLEDFTAARHH